MGQPVTVIESPSSIPGVLRFETNRPLTGMGLEVYRSLDDVHADRPADLVARTVLADGGVASVSIGSNIITVRLAHGDGAGIAERLAELFIHYREGVEVVIPEGVEA